MAQVVIKQVTLESGQNVYEAHCPHDPTIVSRKPNKNPIKKEEIKDVETRLDSNVYRTRTKNSKSDSQE